MLSVACAIGYGLVHDQITAHLCVEYFSIAHPRVIDSESPIMLALVWGVLATWWVGVILGVPLAAAARAGSWPKLEPSNLVHPILVLLGVMGLSAAIGGFVVSGVEGDNLAYFAPAMAKRIPVEKHQLFFAVWAAHSISYATGFLGGLALTGFTLFRRWRLSRIFTASPSPQTAAPVLP